MKQKLIPLSLLLFSVIILSACTGGGGSDEAPHSIGSASAPVVIQEFSDVECPACAAISPQAEEVVRNNSDIARMEYYHFPLSYHENAFLGAEAVECAGDQGKFWEYLGLTFQNQKRLNTDFFYTLADQLNLNSDTFAACLDGHEKKGKVLAHRADGRRRQIPGTPSIFVNGELIKWGGAEAFESYIKSLAR